MPPSRARGDLLCVARTAAAIAASVLLAGESAGWLDPAPRWLLAAAAAAGLLLAAPPLLSLARGGRRPGRLVATMAATGVVAALLASNGLLRETRVAAIQEGSREDEVPRDVRVRAVAIQSDVRRLLHELAAPLEVARGPAASFAGNRGDAFGLLDRIDQETGFLTHGRGLSLFGADGLVIAWAGTSYPVPCGLLEGLDPGRVVYRAVAETHLTRLYALLRSGRLILAAEATIDSNLDPRARETALPAMKREPRASPLKLQDYRDEPTGFADYLERGGDLVGGTPAGERRVFFVALRGPSREFLGYARLQAAGRSERIAEARATHRQAAAAILTLLAGWLLAVILLPRPQERGAASIAARARRAAAALLVVWSGRVLLSWFPPRLELAGVDLFDPSLFGSAGFFHLLRSPGDLLLTALALLGSAVLGARLAGLWLTSLERDETPARLRGVAAAAGAGSLVLLAGAAIARGPALAAHLVHNSAVDLLAVEPLPTDPAALVMQAAVLAGLLALFLLALSAAALASAAAHPLEGLRRLLPRPGAGLAAWTVRAFLPGTIFAALLYGPLVVPATRHVVQSIFEETLVPLVRGGHRARATILRGTIDALRAMPDLPERVATAEDRTGASLALDLWMATPLAAAGYDASIRVTGADGALISRFSRNLPPAFDSRMSDEREIQPGQPVVVRAGLPGLMQKSVLPARHHLWDDAGRPVATVTICLLDDFDNLPFLIPETPYARALSPQARRMTGLPPAVHMIQLARYGPDGAPDAGSPREAPGLPDGWTELLVDDEASLWADRQAGARPMRYLFFGSGDGIFALGFPRATGMERAARAIRTTLLGLELLALMAASAALFQLKGSLRGAWARLFSALGRTHYRKLLATFTAAGLIPLVILSTLISGFLARELEQDIEERGRQGIRSAGSLARAILDQPGEDRRNLSDDVIYWLSEQVGNDVNLYGDGELIATSRRELFASGLRSPRVDGGIFRAIEIEGRRMAMGRETLRGYHYLTISAPAVSGAGRREGLLSLPLDAQAAEAKARAREVGDVLLIASLLMVLLTGGVGYLLARRVSRPIRSLRAAAARIAAGDLDASVDEHPRDETGDLIATFNSMARAIKEQREDLERRKDYIERILRHATIGVISTDVAGRVVTVNPAASAILDLPHLCAGDDLLKLASERPRLKALTRAMMEPSPASLRDIELSPGGPDADRTVRARVVPFPEGHGLIVLLEDVTETVRSNRLAAWAEMARRIAHEIKNPLTPIQLSAEHIGRVHREGSPDFAQVMKECLATILREVANLREISAEFSAYARIPTPRREPTPMAAFLSEVLRPYRTAPPAHVDLHLEIGPDLPTLDVDRSLLRRALVNLIENALQAMPRGGTLTVRAWLDGEDLWIEVADTGVGMDAEALGRIFEPYFSTKDAGTGLGLAISRKAVEEHGGVIEVSSAPGGGTTMRVRLPAAILASAQGEPREPRPAVSRFG